MAQFSQKVIDYFIYSYDINTGEKMGGSGFKPDELLKVVRVRSSKLKPKVQGGLDYVLFLTKEDKKTLKFVLKWQRQLDNGKYTVTLDHPYIPAGASLTGANGVTWGKSGVEEIINSDEKQLEVIKWIVGIIERPKGAYKSDFIQDGPWKIIQDPWDPDVTPPQDTGDTTRQVSKFKPEQTFVPQTNRFIKDNSYTKQYKFVIENPPTYPEENNVNAIISVMSLEEFAKENPGDVEKLAGYRTITQVVNGVPTFVSQRRDLKDNYLSNIEILAIPNQNPRTKGPLDDRNSYVSGSDGSKKIAFTLTKGERIDSIGFNPNASVDDFINESLRQSVEVYKQIVYGVLQNPQYTENLEKVFANQLTEEQLKKIYEDLLNLPENKFGLVQTQTSTPEPQTEDPKTEQPNIVEPAKTGKYIFNVGTVSNSGILTNTELGTFSVINAFLDENPYQYTDEEILTDDEYSEVSSQDLEEVFKEVPINIIDDSNPDKVIIYSNNTNNIGDSGNTKPDKVKSGKGPLDPNKLCGLASSNNVNNIYPRSKKWLKGPADVIVVASNPPTVSINLSKQPIVKYQKTLVTPEEYIKAAEKIINKLAPGAKSNYKRAILTSAFTISRQEQGSGTGFKGFNNNISGIEASGFSVYSADDVVGRVKLTEGGTGKEKFYYAFSSIGSGLVPLLSKIMDRNMFATGGSPNEFAWRYFRDWNGFGGRTTSTYATHRDDCKLISNLESLYKSALKQIDKYCSL